MACLPHHFLCHPERRPPEPRDLGFRDAFVSRNFRVFLIAAQFFVSSRAEVAGVEGPRLPRGDKARQRNINQPRDCSCLTAAPRSETG
jgi:hypothetical protein